MNNLGQIGEGIAAQHYRKLGFRVIAQNYIFPKGKQTGELDLVVVKDANLELVFVEVKTRRSKTFGEAVESIDRNKQRRLVRTAKLFLHLHPEYQDFDYQIDVAIVDVDNQAQPVIIIPNAIDDTD